MKTNSNWPLKPFGDLTENFDSLRIPVKEANRRPGPYPYYGASGIVDHVDEYIFDGEYLLVAEDGENLRTRRMPIAFMATGRFWVNNHAHVVRAKNSNITRFLMYALRIAPIKSYLTGSTMPKLTQANFNRIPVLAPPRYFQEIIAHILGTLDDKIELNRRMNQTLEEMARALFKSWFVDFDPVHAKAEGRDPVGMDAETAALFPDRLGDSELGTIPWGWTVEPVGDLARVVGGSTPSTTVPKFWEGGTIHWTTPKDLANATSPVLLRTERMITEAGLSKISSGLLPRGTLLLSSRAPVGYLALAQMPIAVNQGYIAIPPGGRLSNFFLFFWVYFNMSRIEARADGTTFAEISKRNFRPIAAVAPTQPVVQRFDEVVGPLFDRIVLNERESLALSETRDILLPKLFSGELRIGDPKRFLEGQIYA